MTYYEIIYILTNPIYLFSIYKLFHSFFDEKTCNRKMEKFVLATYFILLSSTIFITRVPIIMFIINILFLFLYSFCFKSKLNTKMIYVALILSILFLIELIISIAFGFTDLSGKKESSFNSVILLIFIRLVTMIVSYLINKYKKSKVKDTTVPKIYYIAFSTVLFGTLYLFILLLEDESITLPDLLIRGAVLLAVNLTMIIMDEKIYKAMVTENEKNVLEQKTIAYENQIDVINQSTEAVRLLKHDMKNHLIILSELYRQERNEDIEEYTDRILYNIDNHAISDSNNFIIDSIINFKLSNVPNDVNLKLDINIPQSVNIEAYDIITILGNLLDNAITATKKSKEKILELKINYKFDSLIILIDNSYDGNLIIEDGKFKTTKLFSENHGLGLKSIETIVEKYDGEIQIEHTNNIFSVSIIIPYKT